MHQAYEVTIWTDNRNSKFSRMFVCSRFEAVARCMEWMHNRCGMKLINIDWIDVKKLV